MISIFVLVALHVPVLMGYFYSSTQTRHDKMRRYLIVFDLDLLDLCIGCLAWTCAHGIFLFFHSDRHDKMRRYLIVFDLDLLDDAYPQGGWPDTFLRTFVG